ncbi:MAG: hypothetical protein WCW52_03635 [Elusimicrobiales bacterium]|jgi:transposase-like protein
MKRKGPQKHSKEVIMSAIAKFEAGGRLSSIAREIGVEKSTVKYWLDNASKFIADGVCKNPVADRLKGRLTRESWDIIFAALKEIKRKLPEASVKDLIIVIGELFDRQGQFGGLAGRGPMPEKVLESSEEVKITVQKFLQKRLGGLIPEVRQEETPVIPCEAEATGKPESAGEARKEGGNDSK